MSRDNFLAYKQPPNPDVGITVVSTEDGKEIKSMVDLRAHVQRKHRFLLIRDDAMGYMQVHNMDTTHLILQELIQEMKIWGRKKR